MTAELQSSAEGAAVLVVAVGARACALRLVDVVETMRALPIEPVHGAPGFVRGLAIVRGAPLPVVDLGVLVGAVAPGRRARFVVVRSSPRHVVLAVDELVGVQSIAQSRLSQLPSLLGEGRAEVFDTIGTLDAGLLFVLRAARLIPEEVWRRLTPGGGGP